MLELALELELELELALALALAVIVKNSTGFKFICDEYKTMVSVRSLYFFH